MRESVRCLILYFKRWNFGVSYQFNNYFSLSAQHLHGSEISLTGQVAVNPGRPPLLGGKELAPVPMRLRGESALPLTKNNRSAIKKVLAADRFDVHHLKFENNTVTVTVTNKKFRSVAQAVGRIASTLQRFSADRINFAKISFTSGDLITATYLVDLEKITTEQFNSHLGLDKIPSIIAVDSNVEQFTKNNQRFKWGIGPYFTHRLFNPDLPLSWETGIEIDAGYKITAGLQVSGAVRKSLLTNLTDNKRRSNSVLPRVHSDWPLYDLAGQKGHIHNLKISFDCSNHKPKNKSLHLVYFISNAAQKD